jgi:RNA polymerase sigma-70 factor (ECF subfamily)
MDEPPAQQPVMLGRPLTDGQGFVDLYQRESELVLLFCARRVLDPETALDLTAETFAQAFRARQAFRGSTEVEARAWLLTFARRQVGRFLRRGSLDRRALLSVGIQSPVLDAGEAEAEALRRSHVRGWVWPATGCRHPRRHARPPRARAPMQ